MDDTTGELIGAYIKVHCIWRWSKYCLCASVNVNTSCILLYRQYHFPQVDIPS